MDRKWMYGRNINDPEFVNGVKSFLLAAESNRVAKGDIEIFCPCSRCNNYVPYEDIKVIEFHLLSNGFKRQYTCWSEHGESLVCNSTSSHVSNANENNESYINDRHENLNEMLHDLKANEGDIDQEDLQKLFEEAEKPAYDGCKGFSVLSAVLELLKLKASSSWSDTSFTKLLEFIHRLIPENNHLPVSTYQAKKIMCPMGLEIERIHACPNDCMLYRDEYKNLHACVTCKTSRYKKEPNEIDDDVTKNGPPAKLLWYFPIIPRLKRLFENKKEAKLLRWHFDQRKDEGKLRHVADSPQWRKINNKFPEFAKEIRNIRFGLSSDRMNPFGNMSSRYSTWPVMLCMYNLPPWLCMKRKYIMMSLLISGPKQPGNDIDVYLSPLINDMKTLWKPGVEMYDAYMKEKFRLHAMIFCTINDFPAYGNLSGYNTKGKQACPICEDETSSRWLDNCKKLVFMGHRRSLPRNHPYRDMSSEFDGSTEYGRARTRFSGDIALSRVSNLNTVFGKGKGRQIEQGSWKKKSIFWELEYWKDLEVRHAIDVMHIEKNVCESLLGLLLNILGKTKDGINARKDMVSWGIRLELAPVENDKKHTYLPPACYTMSKAEKTQFCKCLHDIKVPSSYSANIKSLVSMKDCKLMGMKSHDCHVLMVHIIPITIRGLLPKHVRHSITKLCLFFNMIHSKVIDPEVLDSWQREIIVTLCELEMYFPPSFFDPMVHLVSHIVGEIKALGPIHLHYMFPFERYMGVVKGYVRNRSRPEGSIVEGYASEEVIDFYTNYLEGVKGIGVPQSRHVGRLHGVGTTGSKHYSPDQKLFEIAHFVVLEHMTCGAPYIEEHMKMLRAKNIGRTETWYTKRHNEQFATWLKDKVASNRGQPNVDKVVERLGEGPKLLVKTYQGYEINGYTFYTKMKDEKSTVQNSGVSSISCYRPHMEELMTFQSQMPPGGYMNLLESQGTLHRESGYMPASWPPQQVEQSVSSHPETSETSEPDKPKQTREEIVKERLDILTHKPKPFQDSMKRFTKFKNKNISVVTPHGMYFKDRSESIQYESILDLHINAKADITFVHWWAMHLHSVVKVLPENKCVFLDPNVISSSECLRNGKQVVDHIMDTKRLNPGKELYLAPYLQGGDGGHWLLFVVCPNLRRGYIVDSSKKGNNDQNYYLPEMVERAFEIKFDWKMVNCFQQEGLWECGHYLMKFMYELVIKKQAYFPESIWDDTRHLTSLEIDQVAYMILNEFYRAVVMPLDTAAPQ